MRIALMTTAAAIAVGSATPTIAQDAGASTDDGDAIIVTARKREENLIDVPLPVSVATADQLARDQVYTTTDLARVTPALEISQTSGGEVNGGARLRGLGTGIFNATVSPSVAFVVDQVPQGNLTFPILFDLAQVEVLRGPQGTLFGQGASAGVINMTTGAPSTDGIHVTGGIDFADKGTLGSEVSEIVARGAFNLPISEDAALRVAAHYRREKGLQINTFLDKPNVVKELGLRMRLLLLPSDRVKINVIGEYAKQSSDGWDFFAIGIAPNGTNVIDPDGPGPAPALPVNIYSRNAFTDPAGCDIPKITERAEFYCEETQGRLRNYSGGISIVADFELSDAVTLSSVSSYRELDRETYSVNFSRRLGVAARNENIQSRSNQFSQELRLAYSGDSLELVTGALYSNFNLKTVPIDTALPFRSPLPGRRTGFSVCLNAGFFCVVPVNFPFEDTENTTKAVFADATVTLTDQFQVFGGLRYSDYTNTTGVGVDTYAAQRRTRISDTDVSGRLGVSFKPAPQATIYASVARGYKPPAIVVPTIATDPVTRLAPEKADAAEIGAKFEAGRLQLSGNLFYTRVKNFQVQSSVLNSVGALISVAQNIDHVTSKGFELGVFGRITDTVSVNAGYQYNDVTFPGGFIGNDGLPLGGRQFLNAPKHKFTLSGDFGVPLGGALELFANANVVYKSKVLLGQYADPRYRYPAHAIVNGAIGIRNADDKWKVSLFARNLTKQREPTAYLASDFSGNPDGGIRAWPAAGLTARVVGVSAGFDF